MDQLVSALDESVNLNGTPTNLQGFYGDLVLIFGQVQTGGGAAIEGGATVASPWYLSGPALTVEGDATISGTLGAAQINGTAVSLSGNLGAASASIGGNATISGTATISGALNVGQLTSTGTVTAQSLSVPGTAQFLTSAPIQLTSFNNNANPPLADFISNCDCLVFGTVSFTSNGSSTLNQTAGSPVVTAWIGYGPSNLYSAQATCYVPPPAAAELGGIPNVQSVCFPIPASTHFQVGATFRSDIIGSYGTLQVLFYYLPFGQAGQFSPSPAPAALALSDAARPPSPGPPPAPGGQLVEASQREPAGPPGTRPQPVTTPPSPGDQLLETLQQALAGPNAAEFKRRLAELLRTITAPS
jgi:hypothetical protein